MKYLLKFKDNVMFCGLNLFHLSSRFLIRKRGCTSWVEWYTKSFEFLKRDFFQILLFYNWALVLIEILIVDT